MKLIELIKEKLGLDEDQLNEDLDLKTVKRMQTNLDNIADDLIREETKKEQDRLQLERQEDAQRLAEARKPHHARNSMRAKLRHEASISPGRRHLLKQRGKL
jgi:hypothetical protein